jgi:hypothetical protein
VNKQNVGVFRRVFLGAGHDILKPKKKKSTIRLWFDMLDYTVLKNLDKVDTKVFFGNRRVPTSRGRVRSLGERRVIKFFDKHSLRYVYEKKLVLGRVTLHPDFYLPDHKVYVEFWGMVDISARYRGIMAAKKRLFEKHGIPVISIYPRDFKRLQSVFQKRFKEVTGRNITLSS